MCVAFASPRFAVRPVFNGQGWVTPTQQDCFVSTGCADERRSILKSQPICQPVGWCFEWRFFVSIEEKVIGIVSDQLDSPKEEISRSSSFVDDLKADSLDVVELVMALEDEFDVKIPDEDYDKIGTVGEVIDYIESKS